MNGIGLNVSPGTDEDRETLNCEDVLRRTSPKANVNVRIVQFARLSSVLGS